MKRTLEELQYFLSQGPSYSAPIEIISRPSDVSPSGLAMSSSSRCRCACERGNRERERDEREVHNINGANKMLCRCLGSPQIEKYVLHESSGPLRTFNTVQVKWSVRAHLIHFEIFWASPKIFYGYIQVINPRYLNYY